MVYSLWIWDFLFVAMSTSHLSGFTLINQLFSDCCKLSKSLCRMAWSAVVLILLYRRQSSSNSRLVDETTDGKSLMKSRNKRDPKTVPWGTPEETVVATDDWPSSTTHCVRPNRKLVIQSWRWPLTPSCYIFIRSLLCSTLSKALEKSRRIQSICSPTSRLLARSSMESIS